MASSFIKQVRQSGGSLYIFNSSKEDLNFLINESDERDFVWSKFVLLDIPDELRPTNKMENYIQYDAIPGAFDKTLNKLPENKLAESFQNYCLNLETLLTQDSRYDVDLKRTISERVFFKWLKELGALRFRQASSNEVSGNVDSARFVETDNSPEIDYKKVVQYIGDIDMVNSQKHQNNSYSEVYIHVPISHGNTKSVLFNTIEDNNYRQNTTYQYASNNPINDAYIVGRSNNDVHPMGLDFRAFYDSPGATFDYNNLTLRKEIIDIDGTRRFINGWGFDYPTTNSYKTSTKFSDQQNDRLRIVGKGNNIGRNVNILKTRLDGITIDFDSLSYYNIVTNPSINSFSEYNQSNHAAPFKFNAVLLYYDVFDKANPEGKVTNLFGVLFLNKPVAKSAGGSAIPTLSKFKPNTITGDNGNAWGLKVNLKLDTNASDTQVESIVNEYNTFSMELFLEAMTELKRTSNSLDTINSQFINFKNKIEELEDYTFRKQNIKELKDNVSELKSIMSANFEVFSKNTDLVNLINRAFIEIQNIYNNKTSIDIAYNLDVLDYGFGVKIDKINNKKKISSNLQEYHVKRKPIYSIINDFSITNNQHQLVIPNSEYTQIIRIEEPGTNRYSEKITLSRDISIFIDDQFYQWKRGQKIKISFGSNYMPIDSTLINFRFYTDAVDRKNTGRIYNTEINKDFPITDDIFNFKRVLTTIGNQTNRFIPPSIDIICIDENLLLFLIEIA
jgi:hypothetical protein